MPTSVQFDELRISGKDIALCIVHFFGQKSLHTLYGKNSSCTQWKVCSNEGTQYLERNAYFRVGRVFGFPIITESKQKLLPKKSQISTLKSEIFQIQSTSKLVGAPFCSAINLSSCFNFIQQNTDVIIDGNVNMSCSYVLPFANKFFFARCVRTLNQQKQIMLKSVNDNDLSNEDKEDCLIITKFVKEIMIGPN